MTKINNNYIQLSDPSNISIFVSIISMSFPMDLVLAYLLTYKRDTLETIFSLLIICGLFLLNIYLNIFTYNIYHDGSEQKIIIKRFGKTIQYDDTSTFNIKTYGMYAYIYSQYGFLIKGKCYRFRARRISADSLDIFNSRKLIGNAVKEDILSLIDAK